MNHRDDISPPDRGSQGKEKQRAGRGRDARKSGKPGASELPADVPNAGTYLILTPDLKIVEASDEYLRSTLVWREEIKGCRMFDVFPDNPQAVAADGVKNLRASFEEVLRRGIPHRMAIQRYDVRDWVSGDGTWVEKFWLPVNSPVFGNGSNEITHLIHQVEDVTRAEMLHRWVEEQSLVVAEQRESLTRMQQALTRYQRDLRAARKPLTEILQGTGSEDSSVEDLRAKLGAPESRHYFPPGSRVPVPGIYIAFHQGDCQFFPRRERLAAGSVFSGCPFCFDRVLYRLRMKSDEQGMPGNPRRSPLALLNRSSDPAPDPSHEGRNSGKCANRACDGHSASRATSAV